MMNVSIHWAFAGLEALFLPQLVRFVVLFDFKKSTLLIFNNEELIHGGS